MKFTSLNARENALKSVQSRRQRKEAIAKLVLLPPLAAGQATAVSDPFVDARLVRVREQLVMLDDAMMRHRNNPKMIEKLSSAQARLAEQERVYANRSLPPVVKAATNRAGKPERREIAPIG